MTETPEPRTEPTTVAPHVVATQPRADKHRRLYTVAAWITIAAGTVFIVAVIFGTGFIIGKHSGGGWGHHGFGHHHHGEYGMFHNDGPPMGPMGPWQLPGNWGPGGPGGSGGPGPGNFGKPGVGPGQPPPATLPPPRSS
jgi:hypothetical protein